MPPLSTARSAAVSAWTGSGSEGVQSPRGKVVAVSGIGTGHGVSGIELAA
jgi:hypothetical protein